MTSIQSARRFNTVTTLLLVFITVLWLASLWLVDVIVDTPVARTVVNVLSFSVCAFILLWTGLQRVRHFKCPGCRNALRKPQHSPLNTDFLFYCEKCDIVWDADVRKNSAV